MQVKRRSLQRRITLYLVLIIICFGLLATIATYNLTKNTILNQAKVNLSSDVHSQSREGYQLLSQSRDLAHIISSQPRIINYYDESYKGQVLLPDATYLESYNVGNEFSSIFLLDSKGITLFATDSRFVGQNYSYRDYFKAGMDNKSYVAVAVGTTTNELGYYFSSPIVVNNVVKGVVVLKMRPESLRNILSTYATDNRIVTLVDQYGVVIYSSDGNKANHSLGPLNEASITALKNDRRIEGETPIPMDYSIIQADLDIIGDTTHSYNISDRYDSVEEVVAISKIVDFPFFVLNEVETSYLYQPAINSAAVVATIVIVAAIIVAMTISILIMRFLKPVKQLHEFANKISQNSQEEISLDIQTGDELEDLGKAFVLMSSNIKQSYAQIESKVEERTHELSQINKLMIDRELKMIELKKEIQKLKGSK